MKDFNHDLIQQLSEDLDSLWRYKDYIKNAKGCGHCALLWKKMEKLDAERVKLLQTELARHVKLGMFK